MKSATKRKGKFRTKVKRRGTSLYTIRDRFGKFEDIESVSRAQSRDRATKSKVTVKAGHGFRGDLPIIIRKLGKR